MDPTDKPREIVIHQSANRPNLLLGGDRELVLVTAMIAGGLAFSLASWWGIGLAVVLWIGSMSALQRMGKADPLLRSVYLRHIRYSAFYSAKSGLHGQNAETPKSWN
jgi:type IV secretion system protein VirB3